MMNPVHARGDDDHIQNPFDFDWQPPVGMMKECRGLQCDEEHHQHHGGDAEDRYCKRDKSDGKKHFAKMKSRGSAYVQIATAIGIGSRARRTMAKPGIESTKLRTSRCSMLK